MGGGVSNNHDLVHSASESEGLDHELSELAQSLAKEVNVSINLDNNHLESKPKNDGQSHISHAYPSAGSQLSGDLAFD